MPTTFTPAFVSSFNNAAGGPNWNWDVFSGAHTTAGRHGAGAGINGGDILRKTVGAHASGGISNTAFGVASINMPGQIIIGGDTNNPSYSVSPVVNGGVDGRVQIKVQTNHHTLLSPVSTFIVASSGWSYYELVVQANSIAQTAQVDFYVNNQHVLGYSLTFSGESPEYNPFQVFVQARSVGCTIDDVYVAFQATPLGDGTANSDDATFTVNDISTALTQGMVESATIQAPVLDLTQGLVEAAELPAPTLSYTQGLIEVILASAPSGLSLACPMNNTAMLGVPYSGALIVSGGTPPYTFALK